LQPFSPQDYCSKQQFYAKPADLFTFGKEKHVWQRVYDCCKTPYPTARVLSSVSAELMLPYFNAGVVVADNTSSFASTWKACARLIDADDSIDNKRPWLDQIALPVAVLKAGLEWGCLDERFNFPLHLKPLQGSPSPFFCHYHSPDILRREPALNALLQNLADDIPILTTRMMELPAWERLLHKNPLNTIKPKRRLSIFKKDEQHPSPDLLITGLPRSGTSYLCSLFHKIDDVVAINEPGEIFSALQNREAAWGIAAYYNTIRINILDGLPIQNKLDNGQVIEDTAVYDKVSNYYPPVGRPDFLLCTKNTLAYLSRIQQLRRAMPHAPIVVCVRHPLDAVASWKSTFAHLEDANVGAFPVGGSRDSQLSGSCQARLQEINDTDSLALKRALLWEHLAGLVQASRQDIILVRYEDLVAKPRSTIQAILDQIPAVHRFQVPDTIEPSTARSKRQGLTHDDIDAVNKICRQRAVELGYNDFT